MGRGVGQAPDARHLPAALKPYLKKHLAQGASYDLFHHQSRSDLNPQVADYISWAAYRKWNKGDSRSYDLIAPCVRSEVEWLSDGPSRATTVVSAHLD